MKHLTLEILGKSIDRLGNNVAKKVIPPVWRINARLDVDSL